MERPRCGVNLLVANPLAKLLEVINVFGDKSKASDDFKMVTRNVSNIGWEGHDFSREAEGQKLVYDQFIKDVFPDHPSGGMVWQEPKTIVEAWDELERESKDSELTKNWLNQIITKVPDIKNPYGTFLSRSSKSKGMGTPDFTEEINKIYQKLIPATDDPYGEYIPLLDPVVAKGKRRKNG